MVSKSYTEQGFHAMIIPLVKSPAKMPVTTRTSIVWERRVGSLNGDAAFKQTMSFDPLRWVITRSLNNARRGDRDTEPMKRAA